SSASSALAVSSARVWFGFISARSKAGRMAKSSRTASSNSLCWRVTHTSTAAAPGERWSAASTGASLIASGRVPITIRIFEGLGTCAEEGPSVFPDHGTDVHFPVDDFTRSGAHLFQFLLVGEQPDDGVAEAGPVVRAEEGAIVPLANEELLGAVARSADDRQAVEHRFVDR